MSRRLLIFYILQKIADVKFREIAEAYAVLSDKKKRDMFDQGVDPNDHESGGSQQ